MEPVYLILFSIIMLCIIKLATVTFSYVRKRILLRNIRGPADSINYPVIGHALMLRGDPDKTYEKIIKIRQDMLESGGEYEIGCFWIGPVPVIFINGAKAAEVILRSSQNIRKSFFYKFLQPWLGTGLLTSDGEKWRLMRRLITPTFHFKILQDHLKVMNEQAKVLQLKLDIYAETGEYFNIAKLATLCALDIIIETAMGLSMHVQDEKDSEYVNALQRTSEVIQERQKSPWLWWDFMFNNTTKGKKHWKYLEILHRFTQSVITDRMKDFNAKYQSRKNERLSFLDLLLSVYHNGNGISLKDIQEEVDTLMLAGHDTVGNSLGWTLQLVGSHPDVQKRIQEEVDEVMGDEEDRTLNMDDMKKLEYLEMVIKESLRLFPSAPIFGRTITTECVVDGYHIPAGTECLIFTQLINKNEKYWSNPESFDPERFKLENSVCHHPYAYLSFSAGPRNCIGQRFALIEEKVILSYLFRNFTIECCTKTEDLKMMADVVLKSKTGINVSIRRRKRHCI